MGAAKILLEIDGGIATITNNNAGKHNAFDDAMDAELFAALREIRDNPELRVVLWKGDGKSWDAQFEISDHLNPAGNTAWYYVRVTQVDRMMAWSSPIWVTPAPDAQPRIPEPV